MTNNFKLIVTIAFITISSFLYAQESDDIIGKYHLPNNLDIEIFKVNDTYSGKIIALNGYKNGVTTDYKNPDKTKRKELLLGKIIINELKFNSSEKKWLSGKMYGPEKGIIVNLKVTEMNDEKITVVGSKYFFWKTLSWKKIN